MNRLKRLLAVISGAALLLSGGCEPYTPSDEINSLFGRNDLSMVMEVRAGDYEMETAEDSSGEHSLKISVSDEFSLRGEADIASG